jgi:hypothetical protein
LSLVSNQTNCERPPHNAKANTLLGTLLLPFKLSRTLESHIGVPMGLWTKFFHKDLCSLKNMQSHYCANSWSLKTGYFKNENWSPMGYKSEQLWYDDVQTKLCQFLAQFIKIIVSFKHVIACSQKPNDAPMAALTRMRHLLRTGQNIGKAP